MKKDYPILEFDEAREAVIEPHQGMPRGSGAQDVPEHCVICFFRDVEETLIAQHGARLLAENAWEDGPHHLYEVDYQGRRVAFFHPGVGAPVAVGVLEEVIGFGCRKFIVCGGCGVLEPHMAVGHLVVVNGAVRDEGVSYHYLPPGREVPADPAGVAALERVLRRRGLHYALGKTWTTDAPYRETRAKMALRRAEGCVVVEMEAAGFIAAAQFRGVTLGQVVYGGDDLSGDVWDGRGWTDRADIRENLFWLAAEACLEL